MPGLLLDTLNGKRADRVPLWLMRQAGRYLPEYRALRAEKGGFLALAYDSEAACEITLQPIDRFGFDGAILFLEDINEEPYRIDRMLQQLRLAGIFERVAGVVFGQCTRCTVRDPDYAGFTLDDVLDRHLGDLGKPVIAGFNTGHVRNQLCLPVNVAVELDAASRTLRMLEPAVA